MAQVTDLYSILRSYANKNNSPYIEIEPFLESLANYAAKKAQEQPEWIKWTSDIQVKFWSEMGPLAESEKCVLLTDTAEGRIYMPYFCQDQLREIYKNSENLADRPFPGEESIRINIPEHSLQCVSAENDMAVFFEQRDGEKTNQTIVKITFPDPYGSALVPSPLIPKRLMEIAFLKIRYFLRSHGNREFVLHKLGPQLQGREKYLREILDKLMIRPYDCLRDMEDLGDFSYLFWTYFCSLVKTDISKKKELLDEDLAVIQSVYIIESCNGIYRGRAIKKRELEIAIRNLELRMEKPPYYYTLDDIIKFTTEKGIPLLGMYTRKQLEEHIEQKTTEGENHMLPEWFMLQGPQGERWYIKKIKYLGLCTKLLTEARAPVKKAITRRWMKLIRDFRGEGAMENTADFDRLLKTYTEQTSPVLTAMLNDEKLLWAYEEQDNNLGIPAASRIIKSGKLLPMNELYILRRQDILTDAKMLLPVWYSIPVLSAIIAFFKNLGKRKKQAVAADTSGLFETAGNDMRALQSAARLISATLVPPGQTLNSWMEDLESRWSRILNKQARENLITDVRTLVRDNLRYEIKVHKTKKLSEKRLNDIAGHLISRTSALHSLGNQDALKLYIELYMVKLLLTTKF
jgi:hypothetical protein